MANLVYFDLETKKIASEVGGWGHIDKMGLAVAVLYHAQRAEYSIYLEKDVDRLVADIRRADLVVGFNVLRFDYTVLSAYSVFDFSSVPTLDLMVSLEEKIGHRVGLDAVADATCGVKKTASGTQAIQWWRDGKQKQVAEYCCYDVKATRLVHEYGVKNGKVAFVSHRTRLKQFVPVDWASIGPVSHLTGKAPVAT
ncbi:MAG: ribonuclease H-like domain-containing protein [Verrucomicrobia bacterium]|nr:ribonuclease H-like domain-containing protein [Verrucomicrobiota bacterium]